jgi:L-asparagine transporter-like permease
VRTTIVLWSAVSGAILGLFIDATLIGVALLFSTAMPSLFARLNHRWVTVSAVTVLTLILTGSVVLGYLEGQLKTR